MCGIDGAASRRVGRVAEGAVTEPAVQPLSIQRRCARGRWRAASPDLRLALEILSAPDARDPRWVPAPLQGPAVDGPVRVAVVRDPARRRDRPARARGDRPRRRLAGRRRLRGRRRRAAADRRGHARRGSRRSSPTSASSGRGMEPVAGTGVREFIEACIATGVFTPVDQAAQLHAWIAVYQLGAAWAQFLAGPPGRAVPGLLRAPVGRRRGHLARRRDRHGDADGRAGQHPRTARRARCRSAPTRVCRRACS